MQRHTLSTATPQEIEIPALEAKRNIWAIGNLEIPVGGAVIVGRLSYATTTQTIN